MAKLITTAQITRNEMISIFFFMFLFTKNYFNVARGLGAGTLFSTGFDVFR